MQIQFWDHIFTFNVIRKLITVDEVEGQGLGRTYEKNNSKHGTNEVQNCFAREKK